MSSAAAGGGLLERIVSPHLPVFALQRHGNSVNTNAKTIGDLLCSAETITRKKTRCVLTCIDCDLSNLGYIEQLTNALNKKSSSN